MEPGFFLSYYRPWDKNASLVNSWGDYLRNKDIAAYTAERIGEHIQEATRELGYAIQEQTAVIHQQVAATQAQTRTIAAIGSAQLQAMAGLNRRMDVALEQQRMGMMLQQNIADLLKIPDSEKERLQAITRGMQFFTNAARDVDLFDDALEEFLKAEQMRKQDYFVLHRIGCIYLYVEKHLDPFRAIEYLSRAGKYAAAESSPDAVRLANILTNPVNDAYTEQTSDPQQIKKLAADSYEKAALASYILGDDANAVTYQKKALSYEASGKNHFNLAKYLLRNGQTDTAIKSLNQAIDADPAMFDAVVCDADVAKSPEALRLATTKNCILDNRIEEDFLTAKTMFMSENDKVRRDILAMLHTHHLPYALKKERYGLLGRGNFADLKQIIPAAEKKSNFFYPEPLFDDENTELFLSLEGKQIYLDLRTYTSDGNSTIAGVDLIPDSTDITKKIHFTGVELWLDTQRKNSRFVCRRSLTLPPDALDAIIRDGKIQIQEGGKTKSHTINTANLENFIGRSIGKSSTARKQSSTENGILYHKNGVKRYEGEIQSGNMNGKGIEYNEYGAKLFEGEFSGGSIRKGIQYDMGGKKLFEGEFSNRKIRKGILYDSKGAKVLEGTFAPKRLSVELPDPSFTFRYNKTYYYDTGDLITGIKYARNGNKEFEGTFAPNGLCVEIPHVIDPKPYLAGDLITGIKYARNGNKEFEGTFVRIEDGLRGHKGIEYDGNGNKVFEGTFSHGERWKGIEYGENGNKVFEGIYAYGRERERGTEYDGNGNKVFEGEFCQGKRWKGIEYDGNGNKVFEGSFKWRSNGERDEGIEYKKEGCYIATAVYGSYDCPEVWTLRRFRDNVLAETRAGRLFIKLYYAVSPSLVRRFGRTGWFNAFFRKRLDRFVLHLRRRGFENTMYHDKH